ncbi:hypothetical protein OC835_004058 [Tilletia horrida]|nr:hypothetical protein OC835_004058 [Tilletia horrida]
MSQVSTTTSSYLLTKFARQDVNVAHPEQGLAWSFFDKPTLFVKLFRTTTSPGPYHDALSKLGAAPRNGQKTTSSMRLEVEWQVENVGSSQTQTAESPYQSICLQTLDFDDQARMLASAASRSEIPLKATYQDDMVGFRYLDSTLQAAGPYRRFQLKFPNRADMFRFLGEIENVCPCAETTAAPVPPVVAPKTTAGSEVARPRPATSSSNVNQSSAAEASAARNLSEVSTKTTAKPSARPNQSSADEEPGQVSTQSVDSEPNAPSAANADNGGQNKPAKAAKGKKKANPLKPALAGEPTSTSNDGAPEQSKAKSTKAAPKSRAKPKSRADRYAETSTQTEVPTAVSVTSHPAIPAAAERGDSHSGALANATMGSSADTASSSNNVVPTSAASGLDYLHLPPIEEAEARLRSLTQEELVAALQELMNSEWASIVAPFSSMTDYVYIRALRQTINDALSTYEEELRSAGHGDLNLEEEGKPKPLDASTRMAEARFTCLNALDVLRASLQSPAEAMYQMYVSTFESSAALIAVQHGIPDAIWEATKDSDEGVSVETLASKVGMNAGKLSRVLRMLAVRHWLRELTEGHFRLTRLGTSLLRDQSVAAWIAVQGAWIFPSLDQLGNTLTDPVSRDSVDEHQTAFARSLGRGQSAFEYLSSNVGAARLFGLSMQAAGEVQLAASLREFPWRERLANKTLVDVGGGAGHFSVEFAKMKDIPGLRIVVQDLPGTFEQAEETFKEQAPELVAAGRATFEASDFFKPNARSGEDVCYLLRSILHDWADEYCVKILSALAQSMHPASPIFIHDMEEEASQSGGAAWPIPRNFGGNASQTYALDYLMLCAFNGQERTEAQMASLATRAGLRLARVTPLTSGRAVFELRRA